MLGEVKLKNKSWDHILKLNQGAKQSGAVYLSLKHLPNIIIKPRNY